MALKVKKKTRVNSEAKEEALKSVSRENTKRFNANVPASLYMKVKSKAIEKDVSLNELAILWMNNWLEELE